MQDDALQYIKKISKRRDDSHKGDYGKVLVLAGSKGLTGAAYLCCQAALRAGSGLVTCGIAKSLNQIMEIKLTEVMTLPLPETQDASLSLLAKDDILDFKYDVVAIGPGLGEDKQTQMLIKELLLEIKQPIILDADGINAVDGDLDILKKRKGRTVITPHPGEMARLIAKKIEFIQSNRAGVAKKVAKGLGSVVCLKGHQTVVADPAGEVYINKTGNPGMSTAGTGDVLSGIITSLIGQGMDDFSATVCGVYLHGLAGDIAAEKKGQRSMIATDVIENLGEAFKKVGI
jgi:NAD(P)H-hydrate epimerase